eukprot:CCRYP_004612-RA/>CCRYP_004612-RA protein AED:0.25 eAED:0.25 QI:68/1/1/1/0/0/2/3/76
MKVLYCKYCQPRVEIKRLVSKETLQQSTFGVHKQSASHFFRRVSLVDVGRRRCIHFMWMFHCIFTHAVFTRIHRRV